MVTVHDILAGTVLVGLAGVAAFQSLSGGDGDQGLLINVLGGETPERDAAPPAPPGVRPGPVRTAVRSVTPTPTQTRTSSSAPPAPSGGGGDGIIVHGPGGGGSRVDPNIFVREIGGGPTPDGGGSGAQLIS